MSNQSKRGETDLDIFEGLGKKTRGSETPRPGPTSPPGSASHLAPRTKTGTYDPRKTLLGIPGPAGALPTPRTPPPPRTGPPAPGSLPPLRPPPPPGRRSLPSIDVGPSAPDPSDLEATHIFDRDKKKELDAALGAQPKPEAPSGETRTGARPSQAMPAAPPPQAEAGPPPMQAMQPPSQAMRAAPPPPPSEGPLPSFAPNETLAMPKSNMTLQSEAHPPSGPPVPVHAPAHARVEEAQAVPQTAPVPYSRAQVPTVPPSLPRREPAPRPRAKNTQLLLTVALAFIVTFAFIALWPKRGSLIVNVTDANGAPIKGVEIFIDGSKQCDESPCIARDLRTGPHDVRVFASGYEPPAARSLVVESGKEATTAFALAGGKAATIKVAGPRGAKIFVDGKDLGAAPLESHDVEPGERKLRVTADRYVPLEKMITVPPNDTLDLGNLALKVESGKATLQLATPGARVVLIGPTMRKEVPEFPIAIEFKADEKWELVATKEGFEELKEHISFDDGQAEKTITITLTPKAAPRKPEHVKEPKTEAKAEKTEPKLETPKADAPKEETKPAEAETGLKINSLPASTVTLDGKTVGTTPIQVPVTPGSHTISFVNAEENLKKTITVDVKAGEVRAAFAKLRE
jgi:hypothetical protein